LLAVTVLAMSNVRLGWEQEETQKALTAATAAKEKLAEAVAKERRSLYEARVALARSHYVAGEVEQAKQQLAECPVELRERAWHLVDRQCRAELLRINVTLQVLSVRYSPNGRLLATVGTTATAGLTKGDKAHLWDAEMGRLRPDLAGPSTPIQDAAFSRDGQHLITVAMPPIPLFPKRPSADEERTEVKRWVVATGAPVGGWELAKRFSFVRLSTTGELLFGSSTPERVEVFETATGKPVSTLT